MLTYSETLRRELERLEDLELQQRIARGQMTEEGHAIAVSILAQRGAPLAPASSPEVNTRPAPAVSDDRVGRWRPVPLEQARRHPLYGVGGWLIVFAIGLTLGLLKELGSVSGEAHRAGMSMGDLFSVDHPAVTYLKLALGLQVVMVVVIYWLLLTKHPSFRKATTALLLGGWPAAAVLGLANPFPGLGESLAMGFFAWALSCAVWVTYLQRSKRVRVTFENRILAEGLAESSEDAPRRAHPTPASLPNKAKIEGTDTHSAVVSESVQLTKPSSEEDLWSAAAAEVDGPARRPGLWAKAFAEARADEAVAKANYLQWRVAQLQHEESMRMQHAEEARIAKEEEMRKAVFAERAKQSGECPSCGRAISLVEVKCPHCKASFAPGSPYKLLPFRQT